MTPTELRALDLEMAEKVMGWKVSDIEGTGYVFNATLRKDHEWRPTESPADAMMVLKKVSEERTVTVEFCKQNSKGDPQWMVALLEEDENGCHEHRCKCSPTLELAICLFAREVGK